MFCNQLVKFHCNPYWNLNLNSTHLWCNIRNNWHICNVDTMFHLCVCPVSKNVKLSQTVEFQCSLCISSLNLIAIPIMSKRPQMILQCINESEIISSPNNTCFFNPIISSYLIISSFSYYLIIINQDLWLIRFRYGI